MGLPRVVVDVLAHSVEHDGPVVLVARRKDLVAIGARVGFSALPDSSTVMNPEDIPGGIFGGFDNGNFAVLGAAGSALEGFRCRLPSGTSGATFRTNLFKSWLASTHVVNFGILLSPFTKTNAQTYASWQSLRCSRRGFCH